MPQKAALVKADLFTFSSGTLQVVSLLNQARAGQRPVHAWFLEIPLLHASDIVLCVHVCVSAPKAINNL